MTGVVADVVADSANGGETGARSRILLALLFGTAGLLHFVAPGFFLRIVPSWVPDARLAVQLSGVAEIAGAIGLLVRRTRVAAAWGLVALLVSVFPANVHMLQLARASGASPLYQAILWARLPLQPLLIVWVLRCRRSGLRSRSSGPV